MDKKWLFSKLLDVTGCALRRRGPEDRAEVEF